MKPADKTFMLNMKTIKTRGRNDTFPIFELFLQQFSCCQFERSYLIMPALNFQFFCRLINIVPVAFGFSNCACSKERD